MYLPVSTIAAPLDAISPSPFEVISLTNESTFKFLCTESSSFIPIELSPNDPAL